MKPSVDDAMRQSTIERAATRTAFERAAAARRQNGSGVLSFDGMGINGPDEYRKRLATLTEEGRAVNIGPVLAAAPAMRDALIQIERLAREGSRDGHLIRDAIQEIAAKAMMVPAGWGR